MFIRLAVSFIKPSTYLIFFIPGLYLKLLSDFINISMIYKPTINLKPVNVLHRNNLHIILKVRLGWLPLTPILILPVSFFQDYTDQLIKNIFNFFLKGLSGKV